MKIKEHNDFTPFDVTITLKDEGDLIRLFKASAIIIDSEKRANKDPSYSLINFLAGKCDELKVNPLKGEIADWFRNEH